LFAPSRLLADILFRRRRSPFFVRFVCDSSLTNHISDLLTCALTPNDPLSRLAALAITNEAAAPRFCPALIESNILPTVAQAALASSPDRTAIATLSFVTLNVCKSSRDGIRACAHLSGLLHFCEEPDVLAFFRELMSEADFAQHAQAFLLAEGFLGRLGALIESLEPVTHWGGRTLTAIGAFQILGLCAKAPGLSGAIRAKAVVQRFTRPFSESPAAVQAVRWRVLADLVTPENSSAFEPLLNEAAGELVMGEILREHQAIILSLFAALAVHAEGVARGLVEIKFVDILKAVFEKWPASSAAHKRVGECLFLIIPISVLRPDAGEFVKFLANPAVCGPSAPHRIARVSALAILQKLRERAISWEKWSAFLQGCAPMCSECWGFVDEYLARIQ
jgi:hypothetical protein